jgi:hypothetical protein
MLGGALTDVPHPPLSQDAAFVVGLAGTAMPFAHSAEDEAERWLRAMRLHGEVGAALQALGVGEASLTTAAESAEGERGTPPLGREQDIVKDVARRAEVFAAARGAESTGTADLLFAVMDVYGELFDRALYLRGSSRDELLDRLAAAGVERVTS